MTFEQAWKIFKAKGPVGIPGAQVNARKAYQVIRPVLTTTEMNALAIARSHALLGEGRQEFDAICKKVEMNHRTFWA